MAENEPQTLANHRRFVPGYHFVASILLLLNLIWWVIQCFRAFSVGTVIALLTAIALILVWFYSRIFALAVQDRVIRLEERLRLVRLLPEDLQGQIESFSPGQLIGLRFASDEELPDLARLALEEGLDREEIKKKVSSWRADHLRA